MRHRARLSLLLLTALILALLSGCNSDSSRNTDQTCETLVRAMVTCIEERSESSDFHWFLSARDRDSGQGADGDYLEDEEMTSLLSDYYGLQDITWEDAAIVRMEGARAFELAVLQIPDSEQKTVADALEEYRLDRQGAFTGYLPEQASIVDQGQILSAGEHVALVICASPEDAKAAFDSCFEDGSTAVPFLKKKAETLPNGRIAYIDPEIDDMSLYDTSAILAAWESGDSSGLSEKDKSVLDVAARVIAEEVPEGASDYDKEVYLYNWIVGHVSYDHSHYEKSGAPRTSYEPYGPFLEGKGVCLGFASAFQLLMDMEHIPCITVIGAAFECREDHAWNMVQIDGTWYCADPTWDTGFPAQDFSVNPFSYFNVSSDFMAQTDHQWVYGSVPEAEADRPWTPPQSRT